MAKSKILVVVDMQNDFITGPLGNEDTKGIIKNVIDKIDSFYGENKNNAHIIFTKDTHHDNYLDTLEGKNLPVPHCIDDTRGHDIIDELREYSRKITIIKKETFGSIDVLPEAIRECGEIESIELCGVCTDICVISNALILRAAFPNIPIEIDKCCCAGTTKEKHEAAIEVMKSCQINITEKIKIYREEYLEKMEAKTREVRDRLVHPMV